MSDTGHNEAILPCMKIIVEASQNEADQWALLETLCLAVGAIHGRDERSTSIFVETMAERLATGERTLTP